MQENTSLGLCSCSCAHRPGKRSQKSFPERFLSGREPLGFVGREGRGRGGGRSSAEWSLCARCRSAVSTSTFSGGRTRSQLRSPQPGSFSLLSGTPARTRHTIPQTAPELGGLARPHAWGVSGNRHTPLLLVPKEDKNLLSTRYVKPQARSLPGGEELPHLTLFFWGSKGGFSGGV